MPEQSKLTLRPDKVEPISLAKLADRFGLENASQSVFVTGVTMTTADLREGDLFVALPGMKTHGARFADKAVALGARAIITDANGIELIEAFGNLDVPVLQLENPRAELGAIAAYVYQNTRENLPKLLATTGTNGKTSTSYFLEGVLRQLGEITGLTTTAERHIADEIVTSRLTTPESTEMHALLARMREKRVTAVAVEVSAQALTQHRVDGLHFDVAGFTNLSHDHLDDYADMTAYLRAKAELFTPARSDRGVICLDTEFGQQLRDLSRIPCVTLSSHPTSSLLEVQADWHVEITAELADRTEFELIGPQSQKLVSSVPVLGAHMAVNASLAIVMLVEAGFDFSQIASAIEPGIVAFLPGRTELISAPGAPNVYVDFGHSPDAFAKTLAALKKVTKGRIIMVFGASGDRDATKRPEMGRVAASQADILVVTDQHPRNEDPETIRRTLIEAAIAFKPEVELYEQPDPAKAIRKALALAAPTDTVLWAGPGHLDYREIRGEKVPFSAREEVKAALQELSAK